MKNPSNEVELQLTINKLIQNAIKGTTDSLLNILLEFIEKDVYSYNPSFDVRTNQFKDSWYNTEAEIKGNMVESTILQDLASILYDGEWSHGSEYSNPQGRLTMIEDGMNALAEIINDGLSTSNFGFPAIESRPFWDDFMNYAKTNLAKIFIVECAKVGLNVTVGTVGIK